MQRKIEMTSMVRHAGIKPVVENQPFVGLRPTILLWPAGTRPDPAVSVPKLKGTIPLATTTDEPELEPPLIYSGLKLFLLHHRASERQLVPLQTDRD